MTTENEITETTDTPTASTVTPNTPPDVNAALGKFVDDVVSLTKAQKADVTRFAAEYLPLYAQYTIQATSENQDIATRGTRMLGHIKAQAAQRASLYGIQLEQSMLESLWSVFKVAIKAI